MIQPSGRLRSEGGLSWRDESRRTKALDALGRKGDAATARERAFAIGSALELHSYGRQLQVEGNQEEAFKVFRANLKRDPDAWIVHSEAARLACADRDFATAAKEMKIAAAGAPADYKPQFDRLVQRLEAHEDINKQSAQDSRL